MKKFFLVMIISILTCFAGFGSSWQVFTLDEDCTPSNGSVILGSSQHFQYIFYVAKDDTKINCFENETLKKSMIPIPCKSFYHAAQITACMSNNLSPYLVTTFTGGGIPYYYFVFKDASQSWQVSSLDKMPVSYESNGVSIAVNSKKNVYISGGIHDMEEGYAVWILKGIWNVDTKKWDWTSLVDFLQGYSPSLDVDKNDRLWIAANNFTGDQHYICCSMYNEKTHNFEEMGGIPSNFLYPILKVSNTYPVIPYVLFGDDNNNLVLAVGKPVVNDCYLWDYRIIDKNMGQSESFKADI